MNKKNKLIKNVAAYARYSTDNQTDNSIAFQMDKIKEYCDQNNYNIVLSFKDEAKSGTNTNRQNFMCLLAAARQHLFDAIVIYNISRGSRDVGDWFTFRKEMALLDIEIISVEDKLGDLFNPGDFLSELINVGVGFHQVLKTREDSINGTTKRAKDGVFLGGIPPLGYKIVNCKYEIVEEEARIVRQIFHMYSSGKSYDAILTMLNGYRGRRGAPLGKNSILTILKNDRYIGVYSWNRHRVKTLGQWAGGGPNENCVEIPGAIPAIIDMDTWVKVQARIKKNKQGARYKAKRTYLLTGLIYCESCGAAYIGHTSTNSKGYASSSYMCGNRYRTKTCKSKTVNLEYIEHFVIKSVKEFVLNFDDEVATLITNTVNSSISNCEEERTELNKIEVKIKNGTNAILNGLYYPELMNEINDLKERKKELEKSIQATANGYRVNKDEIKKMFIHKIRNNDVDMLELIQAHVLKIKIHPDGSFTLSMGVHFTNCGGRI